MSNVVPYGQPSPYGQSSPFLLVIGDIGITDKLVVTSMGNCPLTGSRWMVTDRTYQSRVTPPWAIVVAIITVVLFVWFLVGLLGLLFLLVKEDQVKGVIEVTVWGDNFYYMTQLPAKNPYALAQARQLVSQAQSLAASEA